MKIEITKKHIIIAAVSVAIVALSFTGGYFFGVNSEKNPKGDGEDFFVEISPESSGDANQTLIYHSTTNCPNIRHGVKMNKYGYTYEYNTNKLYPFYFCSTCMDGELIHSCEMNILGAFRQQQKNKEAEVTEVAVTEVAEPSE